MRKSRIGLITSLSVLALALSASAVFAYASWQFNASDEISNNLDLGITDWAFDQTPISENEKIIIDVDGNVYVDGELDPDISVTYGDGTLPDPAGGSIVIEIGVVDGVLEVTDFDAKDLCRTGTWWGGSENAEITFPSEIVINGDSYAIVGIYNPVTIDVDRAAFGKSTATFNIPEGYRFICDDAFQDTSTSGTGIWLDDSTAIFNLPSTLTYLGNHAFKFNVARLTIDVNFAGTKQQFKDLVNSSKAAYEAEHPGQTYSFFTGANGNINIDCSDGTVVYNRNGAYVSG